MQLPPRMIADKMSGFSGVLQLTDLDDFIGTSLLGLPFPSYWISASRSWPGVHKASQGGEKSYNWEWNWSKD